jgi:hypothetical protein
MVEHGILSWVAKSMEKYVIPILDSWDFEFWHLKGGVVTF